MRKGFIMLFLLSFCVAAIQAREVNTRKAMNLDVTAVSQISANADLAKSIINTAKKAAAEAEAAEDPVAQNNLAVKNALFEIYKKHETDKFAKSLYQIWVDYKDIANGQLWDGVFHAKLANICNKLKNIGKQNPALQGEVEAALRKGQYRYRYDYRPDQLFWKDYCAVMTFDEAVKSSHKIINWQGVGSVWTNIEKN